VPELDLSIRPYDPSDLDACRSLWRELTERHREIYDDPTIGGSDPGIYFDSTYLARADLAGVWVAELDGQVVGLHGLLIDGDHGEIEPIVVTAERRSRGIGRRLLGHAVEQARARRVRLLSIRPVARNVEAMRLFHRAGFRLLGHIDMFMDLSGERAFKGDVSIHGLDFRH
jgi:GNAT superfamily N-acetyltransferase